MGPLFRVFFAHRRDATDWPLGRVAVERIFRAAIGDARTVEVRAGYEDWHERFKFCGSWDAWAIDVGAGTTYGTQEPRYHAIVVPDRDGLGRATEQIVRVALAKHKPVFWYDAPDFDAFDTEKFQGPPDARREAAVRHAPIEKLGALSKVVDVRRVSDDYKFSADLIFAGTV